MRQNDMDISIIRPCSKCGEAKEVCCLIDGKPWCGDCFDKALTGEHDPVVDEIMQEEDSAREREMQSMWL